MISSISDAVSTIGATSSPPGPAIPDLDLGSDDFGDDKSDATYGANSRAPKSSDTEKNSCSLFTSDNASIKNITNSYLGTGGYMHILETVVGDKGTGNQAKFAEEKFLKAVIGKESPLPEAANSAVHGSRNPDLGHTMITSMILNLWSRKTNLYCAMNSLMLWDGHVPKQVVQTLNLYGFSTPYPYQTKAVESISKDAIRLARSAANNPEKLPLLPYDNFNWMTHAWETSATHGNISHDQVSALLVMLQLPDGSPPGEAGQLASVENFAQTAQTRHRIPQNQSLKEILPTAADQPRGVRSPYRGYLPTGYLPPK
ncbi:hypothetical protein C8R44DRAFT_906250 [Mycena epipterygia]|nr:hypothetical protein C8R44DRAFT_906250 [Mycena epipterygia]